ncbi:MAG: hypothetical protein U0798_14550 [Gemmataceae bacterium]
MVDWSESTNRVVALKHKKQRGIFGTSYLPSSSLCLLTTDGKLIAELEREDAFFPHEIRFLLTVNPSPTLKIGRKTRMPIGC